MTANLGTATIRIDTNNADLQKNLNQAKKIIDKNIGDIQSKMVNITTAISRGVGSFIGVAVTQSAKLAGGVTGILDAAKNVAANISGEFASKFATGLGAARSAVTPVVDSINDLGLSFDDLLSPMGVATVAFDVLRKVAINNIDSIIDYITDFINGFVDLYNESIVFRAVIETIKQQFKLLYDVGKFVINSFINGFGTIGRIIKAAITGNFKEISGIVRGGLTEAFGDVVTLAGDVGETIGESVGNTLRNRLDRVEREDVANFFNGFVGQAQDAAEKVAKTVAAIIPRPQLAASPQIGQVATPQVESSGLTDFYIDLQNQIRKSTQLNKAFGDSYDIIGEKTSIYEGAIKSLIDNGFSAMSPEVTELSAKLRELQADTSVVVADITSDINSLVSGFLDAVGQAVAQGNSLGGVLGAGLKSVFTSLGGLMIKLGQVAIKTAIGIQAIQVALKSLNPVVAAIAGGALIAFGTVIKSSVSDLGAPALAKGGLAFGETLAVVGDNPNAKIDPEVIAPLSKLKGLLSDVGGVQRLYAEVRGEDILLSTERAAANQRRVTGK